MLMLCYFAHDIVNHYDSIKITVENTNKKGAQNTITSESSMEEEVTFISSINPFHFLNSGSEKLFLLTDFYPNKLSYPVWLPPEIS